MSPQVDLILHGPFPKSPDQIAPWAAKTRRTIEDSSRRFAHYMAICSVAADDRLRRLLILQGGGVAAYVFLSGRTPRDLDFLVRGRRNEDLDPEHRKELIAATQDAIKRGIRRFCPDANPASTTFSEMIRVELYGSQFEFDCVEFSLDREDLTMSATNLHTTVGRKMASLAQNSEMGNRKYRHQDVFDIASLIASNRNKIDPAAAAAAFRGNPPLNWTPATPPRRFFTPDLRWMASKNYESLRPSTFEQYIEFDDAWDALQRLYVRMFDSI